MRNSIGNTPYQKVGKDMTWPKLDQSDIEWTLRYGGDEDILKKRMLIASIVSAYMGIINKSQKDRNEICKELKEQFEFEALFKGEGE